MSASFSVKISGEKKAIKNLYLMEKRSAELQLVFLKAQRELAAANAANFATNGLPVGGWAPLDPKYGAWKSTRTPGPTMIRTGALFKSLTSLSDSVNRISGTSAQFGTNVEYAKFHQNGTRHMPKRQILFQPPLFARLIAADTGQFIVDGRV